MGKHMHGHGKMSADGTHSHYKPLGPQGKIHRDDADKGGRAAESLRTLIVKKDGGHAKKSGRGHASSY